MNKSPAPISPESYASIFFGGSFDPPHVGHVEMAAAATRLMPRAKLYVVPAFSPPRLAGKDAPTSGFNHRVAMCKLAFPAATIDVSEEHLPKPTFTVQTLRQCKLSKPTALLIGTDQFNQFDLWREPQSILTMASLLVANRDKHEVEVASLAKKLFCSARQETATVYRLEGSDWHSAVILLGNDLFDISSTTIRNDKCQLEQWVPEAVATYIAKNNLYGELSNVAN